jgi:cytochrome P450
LHDKEVYGEDVEDFNPDRFMYGERLNLRVPQPSTAFGFGRRVCAGKDAAEASIWIAVTSLLAVFNFSGKGKKLDDYGDFESGIISCVVPY